jgi:hypothetical protein
MAEPGGEVTLADVIVASGAAEAPLDEDRFYQVLEEHKQHMPSEEELLRQHTSGPRVSFRIKPNESMGRPLVARLVEGDAAAETTIGHGKEVTPEYSFVAQRYKNYHGKSGIGYAGGLEFANGFAVVNDHRGIVRGLIRKNVVSVAIRNLGQVDITESRSGVIVTQWKDGQLLVPGSGPGAEEGPEAEEPQAAPAEEPAPRERIELRAAPEKPAEPEKVVRFRKARDRISEEKAADIKEWVEGMKQGLNESASSERNVVYDQEGVTIVNRRSTVRTRGRARDGIILTAGMPARAYYQAEETTIYYGQNESDFGSYGRLYRTERQDAVMTIILNPEAAEPEALKFDLEAADPVEEIARLAEGMTVDGRPLEAEEAEKEVIDLIADAGLALIARR